MSGNWKNDKLCETSGIMQFPLSYVDISFISF